jgi:hypothetical protein
MKDQTTRATPTPCPPPCAPGRPSRPVPAAMRGGLIPVQYLCIAHTHRALCSCASHSYGESGTRGTEHTQRSPRSSRSGLASQLAPLRSQTQVEAGSCRVSSRVSRCASGAISSAVPSTNRPGCKLCRRFMACSGVRCSVMLVGRPVRERTLSTAMPAVVARFRALALRL